MIRFDYSKHHEWNEREWRFIESSSSNNSSWCEIFTIFRSILRFERHNDEEWSKEIQWQWDLAILLLLFSLLNSLIVLLLLFIFLLSIQLSCFCCSQSSNVDFIMFFLLMKLSLSFFSYRRWFWKCHEKSLIHFLQSLVCDSHVDMKDKQLID